MNCLFGGFLFYSAARPRKSFRAGRSPVAKDFTFTYGASVIKYIVYQKNVSLLIEMELSVSSDRKTMGLFIHASVSPPLTRSLSASADEGGIYRLLVTPIRCYLGIRKPITVELSNLKPVSFPLVAVSCHFSARCDPPPPLSPPISARLPEFIRGTPLSTGSPFSISSPPGLDSMGDSYSTLPLAPENHSAQDGVQSPKTLHLLMVQV